MVSFQEGSELLTELAGVAVDAKQVERTAEALGKEIAEDERVHSEPRDFLARRGLCISAWMEPGFLYVRRISWAAPANNRMDPRRPGR